jgi:Domain of unknown function (DUF4340)
MKGKTFLSLLVAAAVLAGISFWHSGGGNHRGEVKMGAELFPELPVNQTAKIVIAAADSRVTLVKGGKVWQVKERSGYPADFTELRDVVLKLSKLKIGRSFAGTPESLARLSLLAPSASKAAGQGTQITLSDAAGKVLADIILGRTRLTENGGIGGQYLIKTGADRVYLVDRNFRFLKTSPAQWLKKEILNIEADDVAAVTCFQGDSATPAYTLSRPQKGAAAQLTPVPKGRTADLAKIDQVLEALSPLNLDDVKAGDGQPPADGSGGSRLVYRLYDGRQVTLYPEQEGEDKYSVRVAAEAVTEKAATLAAKALEKSAEDEKTKTGKGEAVASPAPPTARQLNAELHPWIFSIKKWQYDSFITQPTSLLKDLPKAGGKK